MADSKTADSNKPSTWQTIERTIAVLAGISTLVLVSFWYIGRRYALGFFEAINIPVSLTIANTWEYAEPGGQIILISLIPLSFLFILAGVLSKIVDLISHLRQKYLVNKGYAFPDIAIFSLILGIGILSISFTWPLVITTITWSLFALWGLVLLDAWNMPDDKQDDKKIEKNHNEDRRQLSLALIAFGLFVLIVVGGFVSVLIVVESLAINTGKNRGKEVVNQAPHVKVVAREPLPIDATSKIFTIRGTSFVSYDNLYLLTYNNDRYYFYECIDQDNKPNPVYMLDQELITSVELSTISNQSRSCTAPAPAPTSPSPANTP